jgi:hypothetical protein
MSEHLDGKPISTYSYRILGCRCPDCTALATAEHRRTYQARGRALGKVQNRTQNKAVAWVRANCPVLWEQFLAESYEELGIERRKPGQRDRSAPDQSSEA